MFMLANSARAMSVVCNHRSTGKRRYLNGALLGEVRRRREGEDGAVAVCKQK